jgi:neutral ceramidase
MKFEMRVRSVCLFILLAALAIPQSWGAERGALRAGAAKVDITPADYTKLTTLWEVPYTGVHDPIYARAIVLGNGETSAAIVAVDTVEITDASQFVARIAKETGIPAANIILTASHNHSAPMVALVNVEGQRKAGPGGAAYIAKVSDDLVKAVKQAQGNMQPARIGVGSGTADININRDVLTQRGYGYGRNHSGPSDKTVWVVKLETLSGEPIAVLINYAVHATVVGMRNSLLTAELPGATSRFVEEHYQNKAVALWTSGPAGDQHPIISTDGDDTEKDFKAVDVLGQILGEEVVSVADAMDPKAMSSQPRIQAAEKFVTCPGKVAITGPRPEGELKITDTDPVHFRLGALMIGNIAVTSVSAEVYTKIYWELRQQSPFANTIMLTLANGRAGYVPDDASYDLQTQESIGSTFKKGCGESTILNGLLDMLRQY